MPGPFDPQGWWRITSRPQEPRNIPDGTQRAVSRGTYRPGMRSIFRSVLVVTIAAAVAGCAPAVSDEPAATTPAGTQLDIGEAATVVWGDDTDAELIAVTVTGIRDGDIEDYLQAFEHPSDALDGLVPYYIDLEVERVGAGSQSSLRGTLDGAVGAQTEAGEPMDMSPQDYEVGLDYEPCTSVGLGSSDVDEGGSMTTCVIVLAPEGTGVGAVTWLGSNGEASSVEDPITWS